MRVETAQVSGQGNLKVRVNSGAFAASLKEGESVKAEAVSQDRGAVLMKTDGGQTFRARLDADVELSPGDKVLLVVTGKEAGIISLSIKDDDLDDLGEESGSKPDMVRGFEDKTLLPFAQKLASLSIPVSEDTALRMRDLTARYPDMTLDEAAFIASNKLDGDESLINAALSILSDGETTDVMLERLLALVAMQNELESQEAQGAEETRDAETSETQSPLSGLPEDSLELGGKSGESLLLSGLSEETDRDVRSPAGLEQSVTNQNPELDAASRVGVSASVLSKPVSVAESFVQSPMTVFLSLAGNADADTAAAFLRGETIPMSLVQEIIPHNDTIMQSTFSENNEELLQDAVLFDENNDEMVENSVNNITFTHDNVNNIDSGATPETVGDAIHVGAASNETAQNALKLNLADPELTSKVVYELLSELDEFRGTPLPVLEKFASMLVKIGGEGAVATISDMEKLHELLMKMFTKIEKDDKDVGLHLKDSKEELFARLAFLEETIARSSPQTKSTMLEQTRRLMDHVRLLNNIDQYIYMQLPVQISEERKAAELYLFKKKGGKRVDPENVNVLLVLDLENMGHWEGLINIKNKDVSVKMEVRGPDEKSFFSDNTVLLHELLDEAGFKLVSTNISYSDTETTPLTALSVFDRLTNSPIGIDFTI